MKTPESWNIAMPSETKRGQRIHRYDYSDPEEYEMAGDPGPEPPCPTCGKPVSHLVHFGVFVTRVAYAMYDTALCAYEHDPAKFEEEDDVDEAS